ncbi:MAG TPA: ATP-dependent protease ATPase subunit HslU [Candidatus Dormibacteraeota bacterium]
MTAPVAPTAELDDLRPVEIVRRLDEYIIGQAAAKRAVAVALRNRIRRQRVAEDMRGEVIPKNILMIGPTGVGKTEIARRLARLTQSPFIKVEATKFTEVGYVGRDVEAIIRDLLEQTITEVHNDRLADVEDRARGLAEDRILDGLVQQELDGPERDGHRTSVGVDPGAAGRPDRKGAAEAPASPPSAADGTGGGAPERHRRSLLRRRLRRRLDKRELEERLVEVEVEEPFTPPADFAGTGFEEVGNSLADFFSQLAPPRRRLRRMTVAEARTVLTQDETDRLVDMDRVYDDAIAAVEDAGIVFIDEVDKIAGPHSGDHGPDVSGQGVQRDLLPLLEGSTVHTRYGPVRTDHILFIGAGAFTMARPSDLIPELQGRFPIRVELAALTVDDLERILVEPSNALTKQYSALIGTEGVILEFSPDGVRELAQQAARVNDEDENIGARRLFTILEKVLEELSFNADEHGGETVTVDAAFVRDRVADLVRNEDVRRYVL